MDDVAQHHVHIDSSLLPSERASQNALDVHTQFQKIRSLTTLVQDNKKRQNLKVAARFIELMLHHSKGTQYRACLALSKLLRAKQKEVDGVMSALKGRMKRQWWFDLRYASCVEAFLSNHMKGAYNRAKYVRVEYAKEVALEVQREKKSRATNVAPAAAVAADAVGMNGVANSNSLSRQTQTEKMIGEHTLLAYTAKFARASALSRGELDTRAAPQVMEYFGADAGTLYVSYYHVYTLPDEYAQRWGGVEEGRSLAHLTPEEACRAMHTLHAEHAAEMMNVSNTSSRFPPVKDYGLLWPDEFMRNVAVMLDDESSSGAAHSFHALKVLLGEPVCQLAFGNYMLHMIKELRAQFGDTLSKVVHDDPAALLHDQTLRALLFEIVRIVRSAIDVHEMSSATKKLPNNVIVIQRCIWNVASRHELERKSNKRSAALLRDALPLDAPGRAAKRGKVAPPSPAPPKAAAAPPPPPPPPTVPVIEMVPPRGATMRVPMNFEAPDVSVDATAEQMSALVVGKSPTLKWFTDCHRLRALFVVHAKSKAFSRVRARTLQRTPQEYFAAGLGLSDASSKNAHTAKRSGGTDQDVDNFDDDSSGASEDDDEDEDDDDEDDDDDDEDDDDGGAAKKQHPAASKKGDTSDAIGRHGKHVHVQSAAMMVKRQPVRNLTQTVSEMGFVSFRRVDRLICAASALNLQWVREGADVVAPTSGIDTLKRWYAMGAFQHAPLAQYLRSVKATHPPQIVLANVNENDVGGLSGRKTVKSLREVGELALKLFKS